MDLGFDPTRLKEIVIDDIPFIFERMQPRQLRELKERIRILERAGEKMRGLTAGKAKVAVNPPVMVIRTITSAYVLRRKVPGIHWEEAVAQLQGNPDLKPLNTAMASTG